MAGGYSCLSWNPTISAGPDGGRFDAWPGDRFSYLYGSQAHDGIDVAVVETLLPLVTYDPARGRDIIAKAELDVRAVQYFSCATDVTLVSLLDVEARTRLNAPEAVCYSPDRVLTRQWGSYSGPIHYLTVVDWRTTLLWKHWEWRCTHSFSGKIGIGALPSSHKGRRLV